MKKTSYIYRVLVLAVACSVARAQIDRTLNADVSSFLATATAMVPVSPQTQQSVVEMETLTANSPPQRSEEKAVTRGGESQDSATDTNDARTSADALSTALQQANEPVSAGSTRGEDSPAEITMKAASASDAASSAGADTGPSAADQSAQPSTMASEAATQTTDTSVHSDIQLPQTKSSESEQDTTESTAVSGSAVTRSSESVASSGSDQETSSTASSTSTETETSSSTESTESTESSDEPTSDGTSDSSSTEDTASSDTSGRSSETESSTGSSTGSSTATTTTTHTSTTAPHSSPKTTERPSTSSSTRTSAPAPKTKHTVVVLVTTVVDGTTSVGKVTKTLDQLPTPSEDDVDVYTSTITEDGELKVVTGTLLPDNQGASSGAMSSYNTGTSAALAVLLAGILSVASGAML